MVDKDAFEEIEENPWTDINIKSKISSYMKGCKKWSNCDVCDSDFENKEIWRNTWYRHAEVTIFESIQRTDYMWSLCLWFWV